MSNKPISTSQENCSKLVAFRQAGYALLGNGKDALFELCDAVIQMRRIQSFVELSCGPTIRRKWPSAYEALQDGRPNRDGMLELYLQQEAGDERLLIAGDHTAWPRVWAERLAGRSYQHQPSPIFGHTPVTIGLGYSTLAIVPEQSGSWALPLLNGRIEDQKPVELGAQQLEQVCKRLPVRPHSVWDSEYGCASFVKTTAPVPADKLFRLRTNLCLEGPTRPYKGHGPQPIHGIPFKIKDPSTRWTPDEIVTYEDPDFGTVRVQVWSGLRFSKALDCPMRVAYMECLQRHGTRRKPRIIWFGWVGEPPPEKWWRLYTRRDPIDHWYRFAKGRLHWTLPRVSTPQQADCWSNLMPFLTWQLWLARDTVSDRPLPWQKPQTILTPGRVCQGLSHLLAAIGTPTRVCKSRGVAPGWPTGKPRTKRERVEVIRSMTWRKNRARRKELDALPPSVPRRGRPRKAATPPSA